MTMLPLLEFKPHHNYVAFFLTLACNLRCPYCINQHGGHSRYPRASHGFLTPEQWIEAANRLRLGNDLPLTLQGGEPTLHPGFYRLVQEAKPDLAMDLMTNLMFDVEEFIHQVPPWRFQRAAPYAPIRASFHPGQNDLEDLIPKVRRLEQGGFRVGLYGLEHPEEDLRRPVQEARGQCLGLGLDFRTKEFLGFYRGRLYGTFKYPDAVGSPVRTSCLCRTTELLVDPGGYVYRCHADLYQGRDPLGHILEPSFHLEAIDAFRPCGHYGGCNPCDVKIKTDRFQVFGHSSVEIRKAG